MTWVVVVAVSWVVVGAALALIIGRSIRLADTKAAAEALTTTEAVPAPEERAASGGPRPSVTEPRAPVHDAASGHGGAGRPSAPAPHGVAPPGHSARARKVAGS